MLSLVVTINPSRLSLSHVFSVFHFFKSQVDCNFVSPKKIWLLARLANDERTVFEVKLDCEPLACDFPAECLENVWTYSHVGTAFGTRLGIHELECEAVRIYEGFDEKTSVGLTVLS